MESALRIVDEFTTTQVFRAREDTPYRLDAKRASLDLLCADCRALLTDGYCPAHEFARLVEESEPIFVVSEPNTPDPIEPIVGHAPSQTFILNSGEASGTTA